MKDLLRELIRRLALGRRAEDDPTVTTAGTSSATQVEFFDTSSDIMGDTNLFWDNTNKRRGIGTTSPQSRFHVVGSTTLAGSTTAGGDLLPDVDNTRNCGLIPNDGKCRTIASTLQAMSLFGHDGYKNFLIDVILHAPNTISDPPTT
jgi:hypothetical protein